MRFNDAHKQIVAALKLDEEQARKYRPFMVRHYSRGLSANAVLALTRIQLEEDRAKAAAEATPPEAA